MPISSGHGSNSPQRTCDRSGGKADHGTRRAAASLAWAAVTLFLVSIVTFFATSLTGADAARAALGRLVTPEQIELFRQPLLQGLDAPLFNRYFIWLGKRSAAIGAFLSRPKSMWVRWCRSARCARFS